MAKDGDGTTDDLAQDIRRQVGTEANTRFLRRMPLFKVEHAVPPDLSDLMCKLDRAERGRRSG